MNLPRSHVLSLGERATEAGFVLVRVENERAAVVFGEVVCRLYTGRAGRAIKVLAEELLERYSIDYQPKARAKQIKQPLESG